MSGKLSTGQPDALGSSPAPGELKSGQGVKRVDMINLEKYVPPGFQALDSAVQGLLNVIDEDEQKYNAAITTLVQRWLGIEDQITEIAIKGIDLHGQKYKIILR